MSLFDASFVARDLGVNGTHIHLLVREHPGKPVLLLLHGYPQTHAMWHKLAPLLAADFSLVIPDLRGYGDSGKPPSLPERMIGADPESWLRGCLSRWSMGDDQAFSPAAMAEYLRCFCDAEAIRASCDDYRAAAGIDLAHDRADALRRVRCPLLVLWGARGFVGRNYDLLALWREKASRVDGTALDCGHFLPEEAPSEVAQHLQQFILDSGGET